MGRIRRTAVAGVVLAFLSGAPATAQLQVPPPPTLPPATLPEATAPFIAVAGPTLGPVCGTASLLTLLGPSLAEGYLGIPLSSLIDSATFRSYGNTALYVCGFVPFPLTPSQCDGDRQIVDALRGLNPLAAQVVGLFPQGAAVDTVLALEQLLPQGPSVAGPLADQLSALMGCTRSSGAPPTPPAVNPSVAPPVRPADYPTASTARPAPVLTPPTTAPPAATVDAQRLDRIALPRTFATRFRDRSGVQWLGILLGVILIVGSLAASVVSRER